MEAEAKGLFEILTKQAEGYDQVVRAAGGDTNSAFQLLILEKLPELVKTQVEAVKGIKIDKVTVWDGNGNNENGNTSTANFVSGMMKSVPPLNDLFNMAGLNLPSYLKGKPEEKEIVKIIEQRTQEKKNFDDMRDKPQDKKMKVRILNRNRKMINNHFKAGIISGLLIIYYFYSNKNSSFISETLSLVYQSFFYSAVVVMMDIDSLICLLS